MTPAGLPSERAPKGRDGEDSGVEVRIPETNIVEVSLGLTLLIAFAISYNRVLSNAFSENLNSNNTKMNQHASSHPAMNSLPLAGQ